MVMKCVVNHVILGTTLMVIVSAVPPSAAAEPAGFRVPAMWDYSAPLIAPEERDRDRSRAQKDPTVVFHGGKWVRWGCFNHDER